MTELAGSAYRDHGSCGDAAAVKGIYPDKKALIFDKTANVTGVFKCHTAVIEFVRCKTEVDDIAAGIGYGIPGK